MGVLQIRHGYLTRVPTFFIIWLGNEKLLGTWNTHFKKETLYFPHMFKLHIMNPKHGFDVQLELKEDWRPNKDQAIPEDGPLYWIQ